MTAAKVFAYTSSNKALQSCGCVLAFKYLTDTVCIYCRVGGFMVVNGIS